MELSNLIRVLPKDIDGAVITDPSNRLYFTGFSSDAGVLIISRSGNVFLTDSRYIEAAQATVDCCDVVLLTDEKKQIAQYLKRFNCSTVAVEADYFTLSKLRDFGKMFKAEGYSAVFDGRLDKCIRYLRSAKASYEIRSIKAAQRIAEDAYRHAVKFIKPGLTEREVALALDFYMLRNGADAVSFETIAVSGVNTSKPHGVPTDKKIKFGEFVTMDFGAVVNGYHSDMTRTVAVGEVDDTMAEVYSIVLEAQEAAIRTVCANVPCNEVDSAARSVIEQAGYGEAFGHSTGHGVGVEVHESPSVSAQNTAVLRVGNVITVEPGIYLPNQFGIRIEDMLLVTADGCENLTAVEKELTVLNN
ncbi:MAG TPA: aminopeptidase P family protein [Ruminococcaceae bacterium]|nr:aminopeptidase P family protein [Oscillospiraceae bacterium]